MAENGLLSNQNLDKIFGITPSPVQPLLGDSLASQKNVASTFSLLNPIIKKGLNIEALIEGYGQASTARQGVEDRATKNYMTTQGIQEQALKNRKLNQDVYLNQYSLADAPIKSQKLLADAEKAEYDTGVAGINFRQGSLREKSILGKMKRLQENGDYDLLEQYINDPKAFDTDERKSDPRFRELSKLSSAEENIMKSLGMSTKDPSSHTETQRTQYLDLINTPSDNVVRDFNASERSKQLLNNNYVPQKMFTLSEKLQQYRKGNIPETKLSKQSGLNNSPYRSPTFAPEEGYPAVKVNGKEIGGYIDYYGEKYTPEQWDSLGTERQKAINPRLPESEILNKTALFEKNGMDSGRAASYMMDTVSRSNKVIRELMSNPEAIKDMQSGMGRLMINLKAGKYGFQSSGQDAANLLGLIQNKEFIKQIQEMRNNNSTGGAVGNVSDREVRMFINAAAALQDTSSPTALYDQMLKLHQTGEEMVTKQATKYKKAFGDEYYNIFELGNSLSEAGVGYKFLPTFEGALRQQKVENMNMGIGQDLSTNSSQNASGIKIINVRKK